MEHAPQHLRIFTPARRLVIALANAHLLEAQRTVQPRSHDIGRTNLEKRFLHAGAARALQQVGQHLAGEAPAPIFLADADIEDVRLPRAHRNDAVSGHVAVHFRDPADVADAQAIAENAFAPQKLITLPLDHTDHG